MASEINAETLAKMYNLYYNINNIEIYFMGEFDELTTIKYIDDLLPEKMEYNNAKRVFAAQGLISNPINMLASGLGGIIANVFTVYSIFSISAVGEILIACKMWISVKKKNL